MKIYFDVSCLRPSNRTPSASAGPSLAGRNSRDRSLALSALLEALNRPFDDQRQARIRLESEAITLIFEQIDAGHREQVSSQMAEIEIASIFDVERRRRVTALLPPRKDRIRLTPGILARAAQLEQLGFKPADALHLAAAEALGADILLSCDDRFCRRGRRLRSKLGVPVADPLSWLKENPDAPNA